MIKAKSTDKKLICGLLSSSFSDNPSVNYIINGQKNRSKRIQALMDYSFEQCIRFGEVWLAEDRKACALLLFPQNKRLDFHSIWLNLKLIVQAVGIFRIGHAMRRERLVETKRPKVRMVYLWFIGVEGISQHAGIGSRLLSEVLHRAVELNLPVYLETSVHSNLPWYERFGFQKYDKADPGYQLFFLQKQHNKEGSGHVGI